MLIKIGDGFFEREEVAAVLPRAADTLVFLRGGKSVVIDAVLSADEIAALLRKTDLTQTDTERTE